MNVFAPSDYIQYNLSVGGKSIPPTMIFETRFVTVTSEEKLSHSVCLTTLLGSGVSVHLSKQSFKRLVPLLHRRIPVAVAIIMYYTRSERVQTPFLMGEFTVEERVLLQYLMQMGVLSRLHL